MLFFVSRARNEERGHGDVNTQSAYWRQKREGETASKLTGLSEWRVEKGGKFTGLFRPSKKRKLHRVMGVHVLKGHGI